MALTSMAVPPQIVFALTEREVIEITGVKDPGRYAELWQSLVVHLEKGEGLTLGEEDLGAVVACMAHHREGGFPGRLRRALRRSLKELLEL